MEQQNTIKTEPEITVKIPVNSPFEMFMKDEWTWISDNSESYEYTELDDIYRYLCKEIEKDEISEHLQKLSDEDLKKEYSKRFPILFGKVLQKIGNQLESRKMAMEIKY